jgi:predicted nucleotidyltransferase
MDEIAHKKTISLTDLRQMRSEIIRLAEKRSASNVRVFGSVARGDATESSDVDLLVEFQDGATLWDAVGLWQDLRDLLRCEVSLIGQDDRDTRFMRRIQEDLVVL